MPGAIHVQARAKKLGKRLQSRRSLPLPQARLGELATHYARIRKRMRDGRGDAVAIVLPWPFGFPQGWHFYAA
jgi:hypothetical protein